MDRPNGKPHHLLPFVRKRKLERAEVLAVQILQLRKTLASRGELVASQEKRIAALHSEVADLRAQVMNLCTQIEDAHSLELAREFSLPDSFNVEKADGGVFLVTQDKVIDAELLPHQDK